MTRPYRGGGGAERVRGGNPDEQPVERQQDERAHGHPPAGAWLARLALSKALTRATAERLRPAEARWSVIEEAAR